MNQFNVANNQVQTNVPQNNNVTGVNAGEEKRIAEALRSTPTFLKCYRCGHEGVTATEKSTSCCNVCCCLLTSPVCWVVFQACRHKEINCYDAKHLCSKCGNDFGTYTSC